MIKILAMAMLFSQMISSGNHRKIFPTVGSGITYVGTCDNGGSGVTTIACTYATVPAGATIAIGVSASGGATGVSDSVNGAAIQVGSNLVYQGTSSTANIWYVKNATAGSHTLTASFGTSVNFSRLKIMVFSGANATAPLDTSAVGSGTVTNTAVTASFTTANANEMVAGFVWGQGGPIPSSAPAPYTFLPGVVSTSMGAEYGIQAAAGTYTATVNLSTTGQWGIMAMALKQ